MSTNQTQPNWSRLRIAALTSSLLLIASCLLLAINHRQINRFLPIVIILFVITLILVISNRLREKNPAKTPSSHSEIISQTKKEHK